MLVQGQQFTIALLLLVQGQLQQILEMVLTGSFNIVSTGSTTGVATITRSITSDALLENEEAFRLQIREGSTSGTIVATTQSYE